MSSLARIRVAAARQQDAALQRVSKITTFQKASSADMTIVSKKSSSSSGMENEKAVAAGGGSEGKTQKKKKTMAELDEELREKLEGRSGDGGTAGLELEGGKPVAMKRGVRENMFRLI